MCLPSLVSLRHQGETSPDSSENRGTFRAGHGVIVLLNIKGKKNISRVIVSSQCEEQCHVMIVKIVALS